MSFPFKLSVYVQRRPHMRDENLEFQLHIGQGVLRQIFDDEIVDPSVTAVRFFYPERWMNIVEERSLYARLAHFCPNLEEVSIVTQSVYIIQSTPAASVHITASRDEQVLTASGKLTQESVIGRLWYENVFVGDYSKIQAL